MSNNGPVYPREMVAEIDRELALRREYYPKLVARGKLTQELADRRIHIMEVLRAREHANAVAILSSDTWQKKQRKKQ